MKMYLSSYRLPFPNELSLLVSKPLKNIKMALIPNAKDYYADKARNMKIDSYKNYFKDIGIHSDVIDLRDFDDAKKLESALNEYDVIWAIGGNTFCLRYEMHRSGFDTAIVSLLKNDKVYAGDSAGAIVAGPKIGGLGIEVVDEPRFAKKVISKGLCLISSVVIPHADNPDFLQITKEIIKNAKPYKAIELKDTQAIIFNGNTYRIISEIQ